MMFHTREAASAASAPTQSASAPAPRRRISPRFAALICLAAVLAVGASLTLQSGTYQDWRLSRMSLSELKQELQDRGESSRLLYYIGLRLNQQKRFAEADGYLRQAVGLDPDTPRLRDEWARALLGSGNTTAAFGELREFAGRHPDLAEAHYILGKFYYTQRSMERASEEFTRAVALKPDYAAAYLYLAGAEDSLRDLAKAWQAASHAVALNPQSAEAHLAFASLCARTNQPPALTRAEFEKTLALAPRHAVAHQEYARWLLDTAKTPADRSLAAQQAQQAIALGIGDSASYLILGRARNYNGDRVGAIEPLTRAAQLAPDDPAPALTLMQIHRALGHTDEFKTWEREYLLRQNLTSERSKLLQDVTVDPNDPARKMRLARWLGRHGDADGCVHNYSMAMHKALDAPPVLIAASRDLTQGGHAYLALPLALRAVELARRSPDAHEELGNALLQMRRLKEAADEYNQAIRLEPQRSPVLITRLRQFAAQHQDNPAIRAQKIETFTTGTKK